jgi:hypothetical protein
MSGFLRNLTAVEPSPYWRENIAENQQSDYLVVREYKRLQADTPATIALLLEWEPTLGQFITCQ